MKPNEIKLKEKNNHTINKCICLQEHPGLRGTPLAMLAAQCNKLSSKSPPPLADAAVGKGFHPWKKSPSVGLCPPNSIANVSAVQTSASGNGVSMSNSMTHGSLLSAAQKSLSSSVCVSSANHHNSYSRTPVSSCGVTPSYGADLYFHG